MQLFMVPFQHLCILSCSENQEIECNRVAYEHNAQTSDRYRLPVKLKSEFLHRKNNFAAIVSGLLVLKLFQLSSHTYSLILQTVCSVRNSKIPNFGHGVRTLDMMSELRTCYPICCMEERLLILKLILPNIHVNVCQNEKEEII